jgi:ABC-type lipoprotein release transport system permease subunit
MALPISYNIRNLVVRWKVTLLAIIGVGLVVTVFVILLSMSSGFRLALRATGRTDNGIVVQRGSGSELSSWFTHEQANSITADPRIAHGSDGQPLVSPELVIVANMPKRGTGQPTNVTVRAVTQKAFQVRTGVKVVQGRNFTPGLQEVIVGQRIYERMQGLDVGAKISIQKNVFTVVGTFTAEDGSFESEIWGDFDAMRTAFRRRDGQNSLTVRLVDPKTLPKFNEDVKADPRMQVEMIQERKYYEDQAGVISKALLGLAGFVSFVMGIGAVFGAMNTMYAIVAARTREIGTLRALGFSRFSILFAFVLEAIFLALMGGVLGCLLAFPMNGFTSGTGFTASFSEIAFAFHITPMNLAQGLIFAAIMGIIGGLLPAFRAAKLPITTALREA